MSEQNSHKQSGIEYVSQNLKNDKELVQTTCKSRLALVQLSDGRWGYIDQEGDIVKIEDSIKNVADILDKIREEIDDNENGI